MTGLKETRYERHPVHTDDFHFELPEELIAQTPLPTRDASRLLHVERHTRQLFHRQFVELPSLLREGDVLVMNDSRVIPARLLGKKRGTGGKAELLLVRPSTDVATADVLQQSAAHSVWVCLGQSSKGFRPHMELEFEGGLTATVVAALGEGEYQVRFTSPLATLEEAIARAGQLPLPPYIARAASADDAERYQTVYAKRLGSVAAPTAGLHFTHDILKEIERRGVIRATVSLEVGPGTFLPVREGPIAQHRMHEERVQIDKATVDIVEQARRENRRVIAVGTTAVRALESWACLGRPAEASFATSIFISPGYAFQVVDALLTNFHLPKSTLVMLVSAFMGREATLAAYKVAVEQRYRFFSYGDAMFIEGSTR